MAIWDAVDDEEDASVEWEVLVDDTVAEVDADVVDCLFRESAEEC